MASKVNVSKVSNAYKKGFFPKIYRFITESWKLILASFISGLIAIAIIFQCINLSQNIVKQNEIRNERGKVEKELKFWKGKLSEYKNFRDVYFKISALEYQLGNKEEAKVNLDKALQIDPNFEKGREMEKTLGL